MLLVSKAGRYALPELILGVGSTDECRPCRVHVTFFRASMGSKKGSQLAQLRAGLRDAGVVGSRPKKGRRNEDSRVGQYRAQQRRRRLDTLMSSLNSFDEKTTHQKHEVLGKKVKGKKGTLTAAHSNAVEVRRRELLPELESRHRSSAFVDRRFGENDPTMSLEDKMLHRFAHERQKRAAKTSLFDLNDDEADITHFGQSLSGLDELPDIEVDDDEDEPNGTYRDDHSGMSIICLPELAMMANCSTGDF